ncbi:MAG: orotate phosphoribosyltransferase [Alphaproteobacteria bacterium]|nr:orotate phosphoribosyltransferase [Alphaproteobacteria bacterium]
MAAARPAPDRYGLALKKDRLLAIIRRESVLRDRDFMLTSGRPSNFFIDLKKTMFDPEGASLLADLLFHRIRDDDVDYIGGMEAGGIPIVAIVSMRSWPEKPLRGFFVRKAAKGHGTDQRIDGFIERGSKVILFEDVTTTGGSAMQVVHQARQLECAILKVISVVDRLEGAQENFRTAGIKFEALFTWRDLS